MNKSVLMSLVKESYIPVVATIATDEKGQALNINADTAAGEIAAALQAEKLILMTDVPGTRLFIFCSMRCSLELRLPKGRGAAGRCLRLCCLSDCHAKAKVCYCSLLCKGGNELIAWNPCNDCGGCCCHRPGALAIRQ